MKIDPLVLTWFMGAGWALLYPRRAWFARRLDKERNSW